MGALTALLTALTAALRVLPLWLAWRQSEELETITDEIIKLERRSFPDERPLLDRLRVKHANQRKQHEALLAVITASQSGGSGQNPTR